MKPIVKTLILSWRRIPELRHSLNLYNYGCRTYNFEESQKFNGNLNMILNKKSQGWQVRSLIISFLNSLLKKFQDIILDAFIENWVAFCKYGVYPPQPQENEYLQRIVSLKTYFLLRLKF